MRLWTIHPRYLDSRGLVALWREALLAQAVLLGNTRGYTNHPQLTRFKEQPDPIHYIRCFLNGVYEESVVRGYKFDLSKIGKTSAELYINETEGQLLWEWGHLKSKLQVRAPDLYTRYRPLEQPEPHPMFRLVKGSIREWEVAAR